MTYPCAVCTLPITGEDPHTEDVTGEDVHAGCCTVCDGATHNAAAWHAITPALLSPVDAAHHQARRTCDALERAIVLLQSDPRISRAESLYLTRSLSTLNRRYI